MSGPNPQNTVQLPVNAQRWSALTFLHWPVAPAVIQPRLPRGLHVQTYDGTAWVGLTPSLMQDLRVPRRRGKVAAILQERLHAVNDLGLIRMLIAGAARS